MKFLLLFLLSMSSLWALAEPQTSTPSTAASLRRLQFKTIGQSIPLPESWRAISGDKAKFSNVDFDDSSWRKVRTNIPADKQGLHGKILWYRLTFDLPKALENRTLLLQLGKISATEDLWINGVKRGKTELFYGCSFWDRRFPLAADWLKPGRNVIAIRVSNGKWSGMYAGVPALQLLQNDMHYRLTVKESGADSLLTLLSEATHLNRFASGSPLLVKPEILYLFDDYPTGKLVCVITSPDGKEIARQSSTLSFQPGNWSSKLFRFTAPGKTGDYRCEIKFSDANGKIIRQKTLPFMVYGKEPPAFKMPVDAALKQYTARELPIAISEGVVGRFGPRRCNAQNILYDDMEKTDARGSMAFAARMVRYAGAPLIFTGNIRPMPENANLINRFHEAPGHEYDGLNDAWIFGFVKPGNQAAKKLSVTSSDWTHRTYRYEYGDNTMDFHLSSLNPAWSADISGRRLQVFDGLKQWGAGLPTHLAFQSKTGVKVVSAAAGIKGADMTANWVLAWFSGGKNWNEFDVPWLFTVTKRPTTIKIKANQALFFDFPQDGATVSGMPLYGVTLQRPDQTAAWNKMLPAAVAERCRYWSEVLMDAPFRVNRTASIDYSRELAVLRDKFLYRTLSDDWKTPARRIAPLGTMIPLAASSGKMNLAVDKPVRDLGYNTLHGPLLAAENADTVAIGIRGLLHYIREVRQVTAIPENAETATLKKELATHVQSGMAQELIPSPWPETFWCGKFVPGSLGHSYVNLLLALPLLPPELRDKVTRDIHKETRDFFFYDGKPRKEWQAKLLPRLHNIPLVSVVTNPQTGRKLRVYAPSAEITGIDGVCWGAMQLYLCWSYAEFLKQPDFIRAHRDELVQYYNYARNSFDWATNLSWDTLSGIRVGNALQESGVTYAGMIAMARMARSSGDTKLSNQAATHALMQLIAMQGAVFAQPYLRLHRPLPASHTQSDEVSRVQQIREYYPAEFNEFGGLSQAIITAENSIYSPMAYIQNPLPEIMRPYQELWGKQTDVFYAPSPAKPDLRADGRISMDAFVYQTTNYPQSLPEIFALRKDLNNVTWWDRIADYRAYLDSKGSVSYRKLW